MVICVLYVQVYTNDGTTLDTVVQRYNRHREILHFSYYCKYKILFLVVTGQALLVSPKEQNASRDGVVKLWEGTFIICNTTTL